MNDQTHFEGAESSQQKNTKLAHWLQQVLTVTQHEKMLSSESKENDNELSLLLTDDYHLHFYQQLPDFVMALLKKDELAMTQFGHLLYHLVDCQSCHASYLELYDALRAAVYPVGSRPLLGQGTRSLSATPHRMLSHLCQTLISQAEAVLRQARRDHIDEDAAARSLLQMALRISSHITQSSLRREALQDLVRIATLFDGAASPTTSGQDTHTYKSVSPQTKREKVFRRADASTQSGSAELGIEIRSQKLEGRILQNGRMLELHLHDLDSSLRGHYLSISVLLGSLIEPVRWRGGNPRAIRSTTPVDEQGTLVTTLGETDLQLSNPEERNLLEAMFMLLEVRASA